MSAWDWPQWTMIVWLVVFTLSRMVMTDRPLHTAIGNAAATGPVVAWVLWMGGFWS